MTAREKAEELVVKFLKHSRAEKDIKPIQSAKQCALIAIDEILWLLNHNQIDTDYYKEVKQEIEKL